MRAVIQRVVSGGVTIARTKVRRDIDRGAVVLVGIGAAIDVTSHLGPVSYTHLTLPTILLV